MKIINCPHCSARFDVSSYPAGKKFRCGKCKEVLTVPEDEIPELETAEEEVPADNDLTAETMNEGGAFEEAVRGGESEPAPAAPKPAARPAARGAAGARKPLPGRKKDPASAGVDLTPPKSASKKLVLVAVLVLAVGGVGGFFAWKKFGGAGGGSGGDASDAYARKLAKLDKSSGQDQLRLAFWCKANGHEKYEQHLKEAAKNAPTDPQVRCGLAEYYWSKMAQKPPADAASCVALAAEAEAAGLEGEKKRLARIAVKFDPEYEPAWKVLGCIKYVPEGAEAGGGAWLPKVEAEKRLAEDKAKQAEVARLASLSPRERTVLELRTTLALEFGDNFAFKEEKPYLFCMQKSDAYNADLRLDEFVTEIGGFYGRFFGKYGEKFALGDLTDQVMLVWIWKDRDAYNQYGSKIGLPPGAGGHWEPEKERLMLFNGGDDPYGTIFHEATHMLIHYSTKLRGKTGGTMLWFTEGIATFFEQFTRDKTGKIIQNVDGLNGGRMGQIVTAAKMGRHVKFKEMLTKTYVAFSQEMANPNEPPQRRHFKGAMYYAEAWSIVYFFYNYKDGLYREKFETYFKEELNGQGGFNTFKKVFGEDLDALEAEWLEFTKGLK